MPQPYSLDLRKKAIALVDKGEKISYVAGLLSIADNTVRNWLALRKDTQSLSAKEGYQKGHSHSIKDLDSFKTFADENYGDSLEAMAQKWGNVSDTTVGRMMKKIGYTRKKRRLATKRGMKKNAQNSLQK